VNTIIAGCLYEVTAHVDVVAVQTEIHLPVAVLVNTHWPCHSFEQTNNVIITLCNHEPLANCRMHGSVYRKLNN
jgi:hypothetical protein